MYVWKFCIESDDDYTDSYGNKRFTPISHRPLITSMKLIIVWSIVCYCVWLHFIAKYPHSQEDMEKIRRQTQAIFSDTLVQKGLTRVCASLNCIFGIIIIIMLNAGCNWIEKWRLWWKNAFITTGTTAKNTGNAILGQHRIPDRLQILLHIRRLIINMLSTDRDWHVK